MELKQIANSSNSVLREEKDGPGGSQHKDKKTIKLQQVAYYLSAIMARECLKRTQSFQ